MERRFVVCCFGRGLKLLVKFPKYEDLQPDTIYRKRETKTRQRDRDTDREREEESEKGRP